VEKESALCGPYINGGTLDQASCSFNQALVSHNQELVRGETTTLQINLGLLCNQTCKHCHLEAGPRRTENMDGKTAEQVVAFAKKSAYDTIDITGGAPEMNPHLPELIKNLSPLTKNLVLRSNLTTIGDKERKNILETVKEFRVGITASFPAPNEGQTDSQRGRGVFQKNVKTLKALNAIGYGIEGTGLELNLVSNPAGAYLPPSQGDIEKRFKQLLKQKYGISFNSLFNFANVPLGRFRKWLSDSGNLDAYLQKLASAFNPCAVDGLMCRNLISISWDGTVYDCDFNLAAGLPVLSSKKHISGLDGPPAPGTPIAVSDHCFACTAGEGFT